MTALPGLLKHPNNCVLGDEELNRPRLKCDIFSLLLILSTFDLFHLKGRAEGMFQVGRDRDATEGDTFQILIRYARAGTNISNRSVENVNKLCESGVR